MLGSPILYLKAMRILMFQLSGFYCRVYLNLPKYLLSCRVPIDSILGCIISTYKKSRVW